MCFVGVVVFGVCWSYLVVGVVVWGKMLKLEVKRP